jgi:hypothetical protein
MVGIGDGKTIRCDMAQRLEPGDPARLTSEKHAPAVDITDPTALVSCFDHLGKLPTLGWSASPYGRGVVGVGSTFLATNGDIAGW